MSGDIIRTPPSAFTKATLTEIVTGLDMAVASLRSLMKNPGPPGDWERERLRRFEELVARAKRTAGLFPMLLLAALCCGAAHAQDLMIPEGRLRTVTDLAAMEARAALARPECRQAFGPEHELPPERIGQLTLLSQVQAAAFPNLAPAGQVCRQDGVHAWVPLDATTVVICDRFKGKSAQDRMVILLHEAFHTVGVRDQDGPSGWISARVAQVCK